MPATGDCPVPIASAARTFWSCSKTVIHAKPPRRDTSIHAIQTTPSRRRLTPAIAGFEVVVPACGHGQLGGEAGGRGTGRTALRPHDQREVSPPRPKHVCHRVPGHVAHEKSEQVTQREYGVRRVLAHSGPGDEIVCSRLRSGSDGWTAAT
jgi:hypothetical protein